MRAWARGCADVAVSVEALESTGITSRVFRVAAAAGGHLDGARRIKTRLCSAPTSNLADRLNDGFVDRCDLVVTHHRDAESSVVIATSVGAHDAVAQTAAATFINGAELVDECVVTNIAPTQSLGVVLVGATYLCGSTRGIVVVGTCGVVQGQCVVIHARGTAIAPVGFVRAPALTGDDAWHADRQVSGVLDGVFRLRGACRRIAVDEHCAEIIRADASVGRLAVGACAAGAFVGVVC